MTTSMAQQASTADWIAAIGQAAGALFTAAAVAVALGIALADRRRLRREDEERAKRNARMVLVRGTGSRPVDQDEHGYQSELLIYFTNHGDRPIFDVYAEAWPVGTPLDERPRWAVHSEVVLPGQPAEPTEYFMMKVTTTLGRTRLDHGREIVKSTQTVVLCEHRDHGLHLRQPGAVGARLLQETLTPIRIRLCLAQTIQRSFGDQRPLLAGQDISNEQSRSRYAGQSVIAEARLMPCTASASSYAGPGG